MRVLVFFACCSLLGWSGLARAQPDDGPLEVASDADAGCPEEDAGSADEPLSIATDEDEPVVIVEDRKPPPSPPPPPPPPKPPSPGPPREPAVDHAEWLVAGSAAPLGVVAFGADVGDYDSHFVGVSVLTSYGHILYLPEDSGFFADFRWRFGLLEVPLAVYRAWLYGSAGYRLDLGARHALYAKGGLSGGGGAALKWWRAGLRLPDTGAGYIWHAEDDAVQLGAEAALAMVGAFRVGRAAHLTIDNDYTHDYHGVDYTFSPYLGGRADLQFSPVALSVSAGRTTLAGGEEGDRLDEVTATLCGMLPDADLPFGGCLFTHVVWADMRREEPYELGLTSGSAWFVGASVLFAKVGELAF